MFTVNLLNTVRGMQHMWSRKEWLIFLIAFVVLAAFTKTSIIGPNDQSRIAAIHSVVDYHTFSIDESSFNQTIDRVFINEHFYSDKPVFSYLLFVPVYFILSSTGIKLATHPQLAYYLLTLLVVGTAVSLMLVYFSRLLKRYGLSETAAQSYTTVLGLGTLILPYALALNNHALSAAFLVFSYYLLVNAEKPIQYVFAGLVIGLAATIDLVTGPIFLVFFTMFLSLKTQFKKTHWYLFGAVIPIIIYLACNYAISGSVMPFQIVPDYFQYPGSAFSGGAGSSSLSGLVDASLPQLLRYSWDTSFGKKGLFTYTPVLVFGVLGLMFTAFRKNKFRYDALAIFFASLATFIYFAMKTDNYGGCNFGFRFLVPIIPLAFLFTPLLFRKIRILRFPFIITVLASVFIAIMGIIQHPLGCASTIIPQTSVKEILILLVNALAFR